MARSPRRVFLLSPAHVGGLRAQMLLNPRAPFALAKQFHAAGLTLAEVFTFTSGLYFRGKVAYARRFAGPRDIVRVITSNSGLAHPETRVGPPEVRAYGATDIAADDPVFRLPLLRDARRLQEDLGPRGVAILLGSIATRKYRDALLEVFGARLLFPSDFVGRGDMSRGALLLRSASAGVELPYVGVQAAVLRGTRAPKVASLHRRGRARADGVPDGEPRDRI